MKSTINQLNAGILYLQSRLAGLTLDQALKAARVQPLHRDLRAAPHRATVIRLLRKIWLRNEAVQMAKAHLAAAEAFDAAVAAAYPEEWARACAKEDGKKRREAKRALRHRFAPERYNVAV